jgi:hypothetical protein
MSSNELIRLSATEAVERLKRKEVSPLELQIVAPARGEATALAAASLFERASGLDRLLPIDPRAGKVPA